MFNWTDELVEELITKTFAIDNADEIVKNFKEKKKLLPINGIITEYELDGVILNKSNDMSSLIAMELHNKSFKILSCRVKNFEFSIGDTIYDSVNYEKYKGKWGSYAVPVKSIDLRIKKDENGKVISSLLFINNFYEISRFVKR